LIDVKIYKKHLHISKEFVLLFGKIRTMIFINKKKEAITDKQIRAARYAKALGHPVRMYVVQLLSSQSCCYSGDLTDDLSIAKSTLSQHLKELKNAGLIQGEIEAPKIKYCLNRKNWEEAKNLFGELFNI